MNYQAILFDLDGTLVDTISLYERAFLRVLEQRGYRVSLEQFRDWYMQSVHLKQIAEMVGLPEEEIPQFRLERDALYQELLQKEALWLPGAKEALEHAKKIGPVGIVTGSWLAYLEGMRPQADIFPHAQCIVTADDIHKFMKPHPHGLLLCADRLGVDPTQCLYIGDQRFDIEAANAAGMASCLVRGSHTPSDAGEKATFTFDSLGELSALLGGDDTLD